MTFTQVMGLPLKAFWSANKQISRLQAERDQRRLQIAMSAQDAKAAQSLHESLRLELDSPAIVVKTFDADKFEELKAKYGMN